MDYHSLPGRELENLPSSSSSPTTEQSDTSNGINTASQSSEPESQTASLTTPQSSVTYDSSTSDTQVSILAEWIGSAGDSLVNRSALPVVALARPTNAICGPQQGTALASFDRPTSSWKMYQGCLLPDMNDESSLTWPKSGTIVNGTLFQRPSLVPPTFGNESGYWPTPRVFMSHFVSLEKVGRSLDRAFGAANLEDRVAVILIEQGVSLSGLYLNPIWIEWIMGYSNSWTALQPVEMDGFRKWCEGFLR